MAITASMVRELRERSGAAMMDCKKALEATSGNIEEAFDHLRKSGLKSAAKKASRETSEGRVAIKIEGNRGSMVSISCETDFVAATPNFTEFLNGLCDHALEHCPADVETLSAQNYADGDTVEDTLKQVIGKLGENIRIAGVSVLEGEQLGSYIHHNEKVGALAALSGDKLSDEMLKDLGMHIAFHKPPYLRAEDVPAEDIEREKSVFRESDELKGKPEEFHERIIEGKLKSYFKEKCLLEQPWIKDDKQSVTKALKGTQITAFSLFVIG